MRVFYAQSRVENQIRLDFAHAAADRIGICQIHFLPIHGDHFARRREGTLQLPAHLSVLAREQNPSHSKTSASLGRRPAWSLAASTGAPASGQSMPMSGSFQTIERSNSGAQ